MRAWFSGLGLLLLMPSAHSEPINLDRMIRAITQIEGGKWGEPGGSGCMSYSAWSQHSDLPFQASAVEEMALPVYRQHLQWIVRNLPRHRIAVTPASVYLCWRRGLEGACFILSLHPMPEQAVRCQNLYYDFKRSDDLASSKARPR